MEVAGFIFRIARKAVLNIYLFHMKCVRESLSIREPTFPDANTSFCMRGDSMIATPDAGSPSSQTNAELF